MHYFLLVARLILIGVEFIWTVILFSYNNLFRLYPGLQEFRYQLSVPAIGRKYRNKDIVAQKSNPADHARTIKISRKIKTKDSSLFYKESRFQASLCLTSCSLKFGQTLSSFPLLRRFYCQGNNGGSKWDFTLEALASKCETQSIESLISNDLRPVKREIKTKHKNLVFELKKLSSGTWPMLKYGILIKELVILRQEYLAKLSKLYGCNSKIFYSRFYANSPNDRSWHFHATWNNASPDLLKRKGKLLHLVLLTGLTSGIPVQTFKPTKEVIN